jgi:MoaA/NifB/PqqE/SkfB family radical SAM enzyme
MGTKGDQCSITLQLETTTTCNSVCSFCPYKDNKERRGKVMSMELFKKLMDEMATIPQIGVMVPQGIGEPLLDPLLDERLAYCRDLDIYTFFFTNGYLLKPERFDRLVESGLDDLVVSLNAVNAEQHEKIMGVPGQFDKVVANCEYVLANKPDKMKFHIHAVKNDDTFNDYHAIAFQNRWGSAIKGTGVGKIIEEGNWGGLNRYAPIKGESMYRIGVDKGCWRANNLIYVLWDGKVTMCCYDPYGTKAIWGDLSVQTIREVYSNPEFVQFREDHWNNKATRQKHCRGCTRI